MFHNKTSNQQQKQRHYYSGPAQGKGLGEQGPPRLHFLKNKLNEVQWDLGGTGKICSL